MQNTVCQQISQLQTYGSVHMLSVGGIIENVCCYDDRPHAGLLCTI